MGGGARDRAAPAVTPLQVEVPARRVQGAAGVPDWDSAQSWGRGRVSSPEQSWGWGGGDGDGALHSASCCVSLGLLIGL